MSLGEFTTWDYLVLLVLGVSVLLGLLRGLVRTLAGLAGWIVAFVGAPMLTEPALGLMGQVAPSWVVFALVFIALLLLVRLAGTLFARLARRVGLGGVDRGLGVVLGVARAMLIIAGLAVGGYLLDMQKQMAWQQAVSRPLLDTSVQIVSPLLPAPRAAGAARI